MARECCQCEYHRNTIWYVDDMELGTDLCTLGYVYDADDCPYFEEITYDESLTWMDNTDSERSPLHTDTDEGKEVT